MSKLAAITAQIDSETLALVDKVADSKGLSRAKFAVQAIRRVAESEADFLAFVQQGVDDIEQGDFVTHEELVAEIDEMIARHRAR